MSARKIRRIVVTIVIVAAIALIFIKMAAILAPCSYCYAEHYIFNSNEKELITTIENLKKKHPEYIVPNNLASDGKVDDFYFSYFIYNKTQNKILTFCTRSIDSNSTELLFIGINDGLVLGNWKGINEEYKGEENSRIKEEFQKKILDQIGIKYKDDGNSNKFLGIQF